MLFRNMALKYYSAAGDDGTGDGGQGGADDKATDIDADELAAFKAWKAEQDKKRQQPDAEDMSAKLARQERERVEQEKAEEKRRAEVKFDMGFDAFMVEHGHLFGGFDAKKAREAASTTDPHSKVVNDLQVVAAKKFFAVPANLELLIGADRSYAAGMANLGDSAVDAARAWELVERAIHTATKSDYDRQVREAAGKNPATGGKNAIDVYKERCRNVGKARAMKNIQ